MGRSKGKMAFYHAVSTRGWVLDVYDPANCFNTSIKLVYHYSDPSAK